MSAVRNKITFSIETIEWFDLRITNVSRASLNYGWWSYQIYTEVCSIHYHGQNYYLRWHVFFFYFCFTCFLIILSIPRKIPRKRTNINLEITIHRTYIRGDRTWRSAIARFEIVCWIWSRRTKIPNVHTFFHFGNLLETRFVDFHLKILGQQYAEINELENILHEIPFPRRKEYK